MLEGQEGHFSFCRGHVHWNFHWKIFKSMRHFCRPPMPETRGAMRPWPSPGFYNVSGGVTSKCRIYKAWNDFKNKLADGMSYLWAAFSWFPHGFPCSCGANANCGCTPCCKVGLCWGGLGLMSRGVPQGLLVDGWGRAGVLETLGDDRLEL